MGELATEISQRVDNPAESEFEKFVGLEHFSSGDLKINRWKGTKNLVSSAKAFKAGDILLARRNAYLRRASLVDFDGCCSGDAFVLRENHDKVVPGFLAFVVNSNGLWDYANDNAAGTMSKRVKWRDLANYEFHLPPKAQQAELAELLWAMDEVIQTDRLLVENLKIAEKVYVENLITGVRSISIINGEYSLSKSNSPSEDWKIYSIEEVCNKVTDGEHLSPIFLDSGEPILSAKDIREERIHIEDSKFISSEAFTLSRKRCNPEYDDVLIVSRGATIGRTTVNKLKRAFALMGSVIVLKPNKLILGDYLGMLVSRASYQRRLLALSGSTAQQAIYLVDLKKSKIMIPGIEYQEIVVSLITQLKARIKASREKRQNSKALFNTIINQVFS